MDARENIQSMRIAVVESRRLIRQTLSIWITAQSGLNLVASAPTTSNLSQWCREGSIDLVLVGISNRSNAQIFMRDVRLLRLQYNDVRLIALANNNDDSQHRALLDSGFDTVVPANAGIEHLSQTLFEPTRQRSVIKVEDKYPQNDSTHPLTQREAEVLAMLGNGSTSWDISEQLGISRSTVANHKERIFNKLQANNQAHAVARAVHLGILSPNGTGKKSRQAG